MTKHTHIGVYAIAKVENKILLIKKARGPYTGQWDLPGGQFEFGETSEETLIREVDEETGLTISSSKLLDVMSHTVTYTNSSDEKETLHHIGIIYLIKVQDDSNKLKTGADGEDSLGAKWINISELKENTLSPFTKRSLESLKD
jgi:8-oxo-dGTP diphosphatase